MPTKVMRFLYRLNVLQSTTILLILSSPWFVFLSVQLLTVVTAIVWAYSAVVFFVLSFLLYIFLQMISRSRKTPARKKLVAFTRVYIRFHVATALLGLASLSVHVLMMVQLGLVGTRAGLSGLLAVGGLCAVLITGYLRKRKSSGRRRRFHRYTAYVFLFFVLIHVIL